MSSVVMDAWRVLDTENEAISLCSQIPRWQKKKNKPVVSESETIQHIASISARAVHGRHAGSKLTACIL
jgi:hypothetical protein